MIAALMLALAGPVATPPPPADPLTVTVEAADADRFAALYERTQGKPTAEQIQREYLDHGSYGVHVFMDGRIRNAAWLAKKVAANPDLYSRAVGVCLPIVKATAAELRATYLGLHGLLPEKPLPHIYLVVGADNSGGTAGPGAQVLGLETLCRISATPDRLRAVVRSFYAHETVHSWQDDAESVNEGGALLTGVLVEGAADFIATLVTGRQIDPDRAAWGEAREAELWGQFAADVAATRAVRDMPTRGTPAGDAFYRWIGNYGDAPKGWPGEAGYWIGQRIWERWYAGQADKSAAIRRMLTLERPEEILAGGAFKRDLPATQQMR